MHYQPRRAKPKSAKFTPRRMAVGSLIALGSAAIPSTFAPAANAASVDTWDRIAQCESAGQWYLPGGDRDSTGGLQIRDITWNDFKGGVSSAPHAYQASKEDQIRVAQKILAAQGSHAWSVTFNGSACTGTPLDVYPLPYPAPAVKPAVDERRPESHTPHDHYTVMPGDTLYNIARQHGLKGGWRELYRWNTHVVHDPDLIYPGQRLNIPRQ